MNTQGSPGSLTQLTHHAGKSQDAGEPGQGDLAACEWAPVDANINSS